MPVADDLLQVLHPGLARSLTESCKAVRFVRQYRSPTYYSVGDQLLATLPDSADRVSEFKIPVKEVKNADVGFAARSQRPDLHSEIEYLGGIGCGAFNRFVKDSSPAVKTLKP